MPPQRLIQEIGLRCLEILTHCKPYTKPFTAVALVLERKKTTAATLGNLKPNGTTLRVQGIGSERDGDSQLAVN